MRLLMLALLATALFSCNPNTIGPERKCPEIGEGSPIYQLVYVAIDTTGTNATQVYSSLYLPVYDNANSSRESHPTIALSRNPGEVVHHMPLRYDQDTKWLSGEPFTVTIDVRSPIKPTTVRFFMGNGSEDINYFATRDEWTMEILNPGESREQVSWKMKQTFTICKSL